MKAIVTGVDTYRWVDEDGNIQAAERGQEIDVSDDEFSRIEGALTKPSDAVAGYPSKQADLDALASENDVVFDEDTKTVAQKQAALLAAGVDPPAPDDE